MQAEQGEEGMWKNSVVEEQLKAALQVVGGHPSFLLYRGQSLTRRAVLSRSGFKGKNDKMGEQQEL